MAQKYLAHPGGKWEKIAMSPRESKALDRPLLTYDPDAKRFNSKHAAAQRSENSRELKRLLRLGVKEPPVKSFRITAQISSGKAPAAGKKLSALMARHAAETRPMDRGRQLAAQADGRKPLIAKRYAAAGVGLLKAASATASPNRQASLRKTMFTATDALKRAGAAAAKAPSMPTRGNQQALPLKRVSGWAAWRAKKGLGKKK